MQKLWEAAGKAAKEFGSAAPAFFQKQAANTPELETLVCFPTSTYL